METFFTCTARISASRGRTLDLVAQEPAQLGRAGPDLPCEARHLTLQSSGGLAVLSDVPKTMVYELSNYLNADGERIPWNTIRKPPSAELRPDQLDSDSLPPYETLDPIIRAYVEEGLYISEIAERGFDSATVERVIRMVERNEYKRLQAPIGLKITHRAFGYGRRIPVARGRDF